VRFGIDRLVEPFLDLAPPDFGDGVALAFRSGAGLHLAGRHLAVSGQSGQRGVHLPERERLAATEVGVVVALQVVAVARLSLEQPKQGQWNTHTREHTRSVYSWLVPAAAGGAVASALQLDEDLLAWPSALTLYSVLLKGGTSRATSGLWGLGTSRRVRRSGSTPAQGLNSGNVTSNRATCRRAHRSRRGGTRACGGTTSSPPPSRPRTGTTLSSLAPVAAPPVALAPRPALRTSLREVDVETWDAIRSRRNVRSYGERAIAPEDLDRILEAARRTPSAGNQQAWDFVVCTDREQLAQLARVGPAARHVAGSAATIALVAPSSDDPQMRDLIQFDLGQAKKSHACW